MPCTGRWKLSPPQPAAELRADMIATIVACSQRGASIANLAWKIGRFPEAGRAQDISDNPLTRNCFGLHKFS
jgi:hypothetical protein